MSDSDEELTQEALVRAHLRWGRVRHLDSPLGWTYRVGANLSTSRWRRARAEARALGRLERTATPRTTEFPTPPDPELAAALAELTPKQRVVVVMRYVLDLSVDDAASALELRPDAVRQLARRATTRLRSLLDEQTEEASHG